MKNPPKSTKSLPFLEPDKQIMSTLITSRDWNVFPCMLVLAKKGETIVPFITDELAHPSSPASSWYKEEGAKQCKLLRVLRSLVGVEKAKKFLLDMENGPGKSSAISMFDLMSPTGS